MRGYFGVCLVLLSSGCIKKQEASEVRHATGTPLSSNVPVQWHDTGHDEYISLIAPGNFALECAEASCFLPDSHPLAARLNALMAELHKRLSGTDPALAAAPVPRIIIVNGENPAAFTETIGVCVDFPVRLAGSPGTEIFSEGALTIVKGGVRDLAECVPAGTDERLARDAARFVMETSSPCRADFDGNAITMTEGCTRNKYFDGFSGATRFAMSQVSNRIVVSKGLLKAFSSEDEAAAVLFHEMAHYYRAHPIIPEKNFTVFYRDGASTSPGRPTEDPALRQLADEVRRVNADRQNPNRATLLAELSARMSAENLGYYSFEQEADEMSLEFLALVGIPPERALDAHLKIMKAQRGSRPGAPSFEVCQGWLRSGWKDPTGAPVKVPLGGIDDPHHDMCYRVFNTSREIAAHRYVLGSRLPAPAVDWSSLLGSL